MKIYRNEEIIYDLPLDGSAVYLRKMMGEHSVKCNVTVAQPLALQVGDYIMEGTTPFSLYDDAGFTHTAGTYAYSLAFYAPYYGLNYLYYRNNGTTKFDYHGGVREHLQAWLSSVRESETGFMLGVVEENGTQLINFDKTYCLSALTKICEAFGLEYEIDNKTVHVRKRVGADMPYVFEYGRDKGLYSLERQGVENRSVVTKLIGKGAAFNLPVDYRHTETPVPDTLVFGKRFLTMNTAKYGVREEEKVFDNIYPRLKDKKVLSVQVPSNIETAKTWTLQLDIPFDLNTQLAPGKDAQVHFTSGELQGESFSVVEKSFNPATGELRIIVSEKDGYVLPRASRQPHIGDGFVLLDILMPANPYLTEAEAELEERTGEELKKICVRQYAHKLSVQPRYVRRNNIRLEVGDKVTVKDKVEGVEALIRVMEISYPVLEPYKISVLLSDEILYSYDEKIRNDINDVTADVVDAYRQIQNTSRRAWKDARELSDMVKGLEAELLLVGNPEGQFTSTSLFKANKNNDPNHFTASAGTLQHKVYTDNPQQGVWRLEACDLRLEEAVPYFLYARCAKTTPVALFVASKEAKEVEDADYYYFRVGLISSVFENARILKTTSGFTQIAGGDITTEKIQDASQRLVIDLVNAVITARNGAEIRGKISFQSNDGDFQDVGDVFNGQAFDIQAAQQAAAAAGRTVDNIQHYLDNDFQTVIEGIQNQVDGLVESHFGGADPTLLNNPAVLWTTESERQKHANDTYTHTTSLQSWKWVKENNVWQWKLLPVSDLSKALANSARAQATADAKRRNFGVTPYPPYDVDDVWITTNGEIMSCVVPNGSGTFNAAHWTTKVKYTDDSAVDNLQIGGVNLLDNSDFAKVDTRHYTTKSPYDIGVSAYTLSWENGMLKASSTTGGDGNQDKRFLFISGTMLNGNEYVLSFDVKADKALSLHARCFHNSEVATCQVSTTLQRVCLRIKKESAATDTICLYSETPGTIYIDNVKLEAGNKPTAWASSPGDVQAEITAAEMAANEAKARLAAMSNDGIISKEEKATLRNDKAQIDKEFAKYQQDATTYGVSVTALQTAYTALVNFLTGTVKIADTTDYTFAAGGKDAYNKCFADYYSARSAFANLIAAKVAATAVDEIQVGGVNILCGSLTARGWRYRTHEDTTFSTTAASLGETDYIYSSYIKIGADKDIVLSLDAKCSDNIKECDLVILPVEYGKYGLWTTRYEKSSDWKHFEFKIKTPDRWGEGEASVPVCLRIDHNGSTDGKAATIWVRNVQIEYGNKASSYSYPQEDIQFEVDKAQAVADEAKARLAAMSDDGIISKEEKVTLRNDKAQIDKEFAKYQQDATTYGVSVTALQTAYTALVNFLTGTVKIADTTDYPFAAGGKDAYNKCFADYYSARSAFANLIAAKVAATAVDGIQIGGTNLLDNSDFTKVDTKHYTTKSPHDIGVSAYTLSWENGMLKASSTTGGDGSQDKRFLFVSGMILNDNEYILSFDVKSDKEQTLNARCFFNKEVATCQVSTTLQRVCLRIKKESAATDTICLYSETPGTIYIDNVKLEAGNKPTAWSPSPADVQKEIDATNAAIADMSSDDVISPSEKPALKKEWDIIVSEKMMNTSQAASFGVSSAAYTTAYNNLNSLIGTNLNTLTTNWNVSGVMLRATFKAYYDARTALLNAIATRTDAKPSVFVQTTLPAAARKNDMWYNGTTQGAALYIYVCITTYTSGGTVANWLLVADNTKSSIESGLFTTGTIYVMGYVSREAKQKVKAGISGSGEADNSVRFWAGITLDEAERLVTNQNGTSGIAGTAITERGDVYANSMIASKITTGGVTIEQGTITSGGFKLNQDCLQFGSGSLSSYFGSYVSRGNTTYIYHLFIKTDLISSPPITLTGCARFINNTMDVSIGEDTNALRVSGGNISFDVTGNGLFFKGLTKISNTNGWDRVLVNLSTGQIAYG